MESLEARSVPLRVEKAHLLARVHIAWALAVLPFADQCETSSLCAAFQPHEDDPVTGRGMLGSQQSQDGAASKDSTVLETAQGARERKGQ